MEYDKSICPVVKVDGVAEAGRQFDFEITIPDDTRNIIYGVVKDCYHEPVEDAVVRLIEIENSRDKEEKKSISHAITDEHGVFVFGSLCANRNYELEIWVNRVQHCKVYTACEHSGKCLKGTNMDYPKLDSPCQED